MPRRPARPISWVSSALVSAWKPVPSNLVNEETTQARAGMFNPRDSVSVAKTTLTSPVRKSCSTVSLAYGSIPAWCIATPRPSSRSEAASLEDAPLVVVLDRIEPLAVEGRDPALLVSVVRSTPWISQRASASRQPRREKMK